MDGSRWIHSRRPSWFGEVLGALFAGVPSSSGALFMMAGRLRFLRIARYLTDEEIRLHCASACSCSQEELGGLCEGTVRRAGSGARVSVAFTHTGSRYRNSRLIAFDESGVTFRYKDYRREGTDRHQVMTLATDEFIRRFLLHVLPRGLPPHPALRPPRWLQPQGQPRSRS